MARYTGADCRLCRREGSKLFLKGERCTSNKCTFDRRAASQGKKELTPGPKAQMKIKVTEYGQQLREKQKTKRFYGVLERQFKGYYEEAVRSKEVTGEKMLKLLELRLDNVVYRMGIGASRDESRQIVNHGHIQVNGKNVNIPSYQVSAGDIIKIKDTKKANKFFTELKGAKIVTPKWVSFDSAKLTGKVISEPTREDIDLQVKENLIIELYSK
ncbi:MAG: 30S ribosomal protein S4 [Firmicutes bacterium]|nr:30S ribosomal protein S4 [Bacillota bacterium]